MKHIFKVIFILAVSVGMSFIINVNFIKTSHFNLITVNSVFIGFLFTSLSMIIGFLDQKIIQIYNMTDNLEKVYSNIEKGIEFSLSSIVIAILNLIIFEKYIKSYRIISSLYSLEVLLVIIAIYYLFNVMKSLKILVESIRIGKKKEFDRNKANEEMGKLFDKNKN